MVFPWNNPSILWDTPIYGNPHIMAWIPFLEITSLVGRAAPPPPRALPGVRDHRVGIWIGALNRIHFGHRFHRKRDLIMKVWCWTFSRCECVALLLKSSNRPWRSHPRHQQNWHGLVFKQRVHDGFPPPLLQFTRCLIHFSQYPVVISTMNMYLDCYRFLQNVYSPADLTWSFMVRQWFALHGALKRGLKRGSTPFKKSCLQLVLIIIFPWVGDILMICSSTATGGSPCGGPQTHHCVFFAVWWSKHGSTILRWYKLN